MAEETRLSLLLSPAGGKMDWPLRVRLHRCSRCVSTSPPHGASSVIDQARCHVSGVHSNSWLLPALWVAPQASVQIDVSLGQRPLRSRTRRGARDLAKPAENKIELVWERFVGLVGRFCSWDYYNFKTRRLGLRVVRGVRAALSASGQH